MNDSGKIAPTAHYTAYAWHVLGLPHAELFATELGRRLFAAYRVLELRDTLRGRPSRLLRTLKNRHALIDRELERLAPDVVVELGAGLSRRGPTFAARGVRYLDVDLPEMVAYKARLFDARAPASLRADIATRYRALAADIMADDFAVVLARELAGAERPVVIAEGVLGYFEPTLRTKLVLAVHGALAGRGAFVTDLRVKNPGQRGATRLLRLGILVATRGRGASASFDGEGQVRELFRDGGFREVEQLTPLEADVLSGVFVARP